MDRALNLTYARACAARPDYPETGATREGPLPAGYGILRRRVRLGEGREVFERAGAYVLAWGAQRGAGLGVHPGTPVEEGGTAVLSFRFRGRRLPGPLIPCRVVWTAEEPDRTGFGYGTLPGHPERGEESFVVTRDADGAVHFEVTAFSRPAAWYARLGGPLTRLAQRVAAQRYARAVAREAARA